MSGPSETASIRRTISSEGATPEVVTMEAPALVPMAPRLLKPKTTQVCETHKQNRSMPVHKLLRKHFSTQAQKKDKQPKKVVDLEAEEGPEDIDAQGVEPISKLSEYVPSPKGKVKITKDPKTEKFIIHTPLLWKISHLKVCSCHEFPS